MSLAVLTPLAVRSRRRPVVDPRLSLLQAEVDTWRESHIFAIEKLRHHRRATGATIGQLFRTIGVVAGFCVIIAGIIAVRFAAWSGTYVH